MTRLAMVVMITTLASRMNPVIVRTHADHDIGCPYFPEVAVLTSSIRQNNLSALSDLPDERISLFSPLWKTNYVVSRDTGTRQQDNTLGHETHEKPVFTHKSTALWLL